VLSNLVTPLRIGEANASWVMNERILTKEQAAEMGFLRRVHGVAKWHIEVRLRPGQETSLVPPYLNLNYFGSECTALKKKLAKSLGLFGGPQ